jgi:two-component system, NtrC family, response regulator
LSQEANITTLKAARESQEKDLVLLAMKQADGNISRAAAALGISRPTLYERLARYGLNKPIARSSRSKP